MGVQSYFAELLMQERKVNKEKDPQYEMMLVKEGYSFYNSFMHTYICTQSFIHSLDTCILSHVCVSQGASELMCSLLS